MILGTPLVPRLLRTGRLLVTLDRTRLLARPLHPVRPRALDPRPLPPRLAPPALHARSPVDRPLIARVPLGAATNLSEAARVTALITPQLPDRFAILTPGPHPFAEDAAARRL